MSAVGRADLHLVKLLLELFVGISEQCLLDALEVAFEALCAPARHAMLSGIYAGQSNAWKSDLTQIALKLIDAGAPVADAADIFFQMSTRSQRQCPVELAHVLGAVSRRSLVAGCEADEEKTLRAAKISTMRLMSSRRQATRLSKQMQAKVRKIAPSNQERAKGGRRKAGEGLANSESMF